MRWTHLTIPVRDLDRAVAFYSERCGLDVVRDRRREGGTTVWLGPPPAAGEDPAFVLVLARGEVRERIDHLGFQCATREEVDRLAAIARADGSLVQEPRDSGGTIGYWCLVTDPDGHRVEFTNGQPLRGLA